MARHYENLARFCANPAIPSQLKGFVVAALEYAPPEHPAREKFMEEMFRKAYPLRPEEGIDPNLLELPLNFSRYVYTRYAEEMRVLNEAHPLLFSIGSGDLFHMGELLYSSIHSTLMKVRGEAIPLSGSPDEAQAALSAAFSTLSIELLKALSLLLDGAGPQSVTEHLRRTA